MKITKNHLQAIMDEARRRFVELPSPVHLDGDTGTKRALNDGERLAYCYLQGCLLTLNANKLLCDGWEEKISIDIQTESSEQAVED